jgi:hypothetical protein
MKTTLIAIATAAALGVLAGCDRAPESSPSAASGSGAASGSSAAASVPQSNTPSTPANAGTPSASEKSPNAQPPVQGREDVRQPEQRRDFEQKGDGAGPKPGG